MYLSDVPPGASFKVLKVVLGKEVGRRLSDMGFTSGTEGAVVRAGFFHGPLHVRIRGYDILIRRCEAAGIEVEPVGDWTAAEDANRIFHHPFRHGRMGPHSGFGGRGRGFGRGPGSGCNDLDSEDDK